MVWHKNGSEPAWRHAPAMNIPRSNHGCTIMKQNGQKFLVVAGGLVCFIVARCRIIISVCIAGSNLSPEGIIHLDSVEYLEISNNKTTGYYWQNGNPLRSARTGLTLIILHDNELLAVGGWMEKKRTRSIEKNWNVIEGSHWVNLSCECTG